VFLTTWSPDWRIREGGRVAVISFREWGKKEGGRKKDGKAHFTVLISRKW